MPNNEPNPLEEFMRVSDFIIANRRSKFDRLEQNKSAEIKVMPGGLPAAMARFDELAASYEQHQKNRK